MRLLSRRHLLRAGVSAGAAAVAGCGSRDSPSADRGSRDPASVLALGDSYTAGSGVDREDRWANRLPERLRERGHAVDAPRVVAAGGWTTDDLREATRERELAPESDETDQHVGYDLVTLCIGANDSFEGRSATEFRPRFEGILERAVRYTGDRPENALVLTIPDYTLTPIGARHDPDANRERLDAYNELIEQLSAARGARLVDLVEPSRRVVDEPDLVAGDGLHPSPRQHGLWLDRIAPVVTEILAE